MGRGQVYPAEGHSFVDDATGAHLRQVTSQASIHHHPFYYIPAYDDAMRHLVFVSHRSGRPELFLERRESGELLQLTEHDGLHEYSIHPSHDGRFVYFTSDTGAWRVDTDACDEELVLAFDTPDLSHGGEPGNAGGTTALSYDDAWWAVAVRVGDRARLVVIDLARGAAEVILERAAIGHPQFHPRDARLLRYAGRYDERMWTVRRDGTGNQLAYERQGKEWIVHETWHPRRRELLTTRWPHDVIGVDIDTGTVRTVCRLNAWHPMINADGTRMVTDTTFPDRGLQLFDPEGEGEPQLLCTSASSNVGSHWDTDHCPYDDGPVEVDSLQHTHPHPSFSPDGRRVVFTSDRGGHAQVYECEVPAQEGDDG